MLRKHACDKCGAKFRRIEQLMHHLQEVHEKGSLYECQPCNSKFAGMEQMRNHIKKCHSYKATRGE